MDHIQAEIDRIRERLVSYPEPNEHAGLFAAQQALEWARNPACFASPFASVTGSREVTEDCSGGTRPPALSDNNAPMLGEVQR